jgi:hypothetical protein
VQLAKTDLQIALILAGRYIEKLPEGCPYYLTAIEGQNIELDIAARTRGEFWSAASVINQLPKQVEEVTKKIGILEICVYLMPVENGDAEASDNN